MATSYFYEDDFLPYLKLFERYCPPPLAMPRGSLICKKGFSHDWLYYLNSGMVKVYSNNYHGYERIVAYLNKNSIFGLDCLNPGSTSIVTIECITDVWVMPFKRETLHAMMAESLDFSYALVAYYCKVMRQLCFDAENQSISDTATRLANFLYLCVSHRDEAQPRGPDAAGCRLGGQLLAHERLASLWQMERAGYHSHRGKRDLHSGSGSIAETMPLLRKRLPTAQFCAVGSRCCPWFYF